jgi:hypothetical protein
LVLVKLLSFLTPDNDSHAMNSKQVARDTAEMLQTYITYQAVKLVLEQLTETNPAEAIWLREFNHQHPVQQEQHFLQALLHQNKELLLRILTVRITIAEEIVEYLPEMVTSNIQASNMDYRRQLLERLTQLQLDQPPQT